MGMVGMKMSLLRGRLSFVSQVGNERVLTCNEKLCMPLKRAIFTSTIHSHWLRLGSIYLPLPLGLRTSFFATAYINNIISKSTVFNVGYGILMAVTLTSSVFWHITSCSLARVNRCSYGTLANFHLYSIIAQMTELFTLFNREVARSMFLRNACICQQDYYVSTHKTTISIITIKEISNIW
jgi:hypothetical protein